MGVDAEMLIRGIPQKLVTEKKLIELSWRICEALGAGTFFISDGLPPEEYRVKHAAWFKAFNAHPKYAAWKKAYGADDALRKKLHDEIFVDTGKPPEERRLAIEPTNTHYREENEVPGREGFQFKARAGECLLKVHLFGRYYGPGYERGDILKYCAVAEWIETNLPGAELWYGGDSGDDLVRFDEPYRRELRAHLYGPKGRAYFQYGGDVPGLRRAEYGTPPACSLCPGKVYCGSRCGFGSDYASFNCPGCGESKETRDGGKTWAKPTEKF